MTRSLAWVVLVFLVAYLVFVGGAWSGLYSGSLRLTSISATACVLGVWAYVAWRLPAWRPRSVLLPAIVACLASLAASTALSTHPRVSVDYLVYAAVLAALYLLLVRLMSVAFFRERMLAIARVLFIAISFGYVALCVLHWSAWLSALGRLTIPPLRPEYESLTFGSPQAVLAITALLAVPIVASINWATMRGAVTGGATLLVVGLVGLISGSRGAWLALAVAAAAGAVLIGAMHGERARRGLEGALATWRRRVIVAGAVIAISVTGLALAPSVLERLAAGGEANRAVYANTALRLFAEYPVTGSGPGTWAIERRDVTQVGEFDDFQPHAHSVYVQTLAELGIGGVLAGVVLLGSVAWLLHGAFRGPDPARRRWAIATSIGAIYFLTHQIVDFWANSPAILFAAAMPVAYLDATASRSMAWSGRAVRTSIGARGMVVSAGVLGVALAWLGLQEVRAIRYEGLVSVVNEGDWAGADSEARAIADADPSMSSYLYTAGLTADAAGDLEQAAAYFEAVALRDDLPEAWLNLAAEQVAMGDVAHARESLASAFRLGRQRPAVALPIGDLALRVGDVALARQAFADALTIAPSLAADPWWSFEPERRAMFEEVVDAMTVPGETHWEVALMIGDSALATSLVPEAGATEVLGFIRAWAGDSSAAGSLLDQCRAEPFRVTLLLWCARLENRNGRPAEAYAFRYLANVQVREAFLGGYEVRVELGRGSALPRAGFPAMAWGPYTYRRAIPRDMLVPSLVHLVLR